MLLSIENSSFNTSNVQLGVYWNILKDYLVKNTERSGLSHFKPRKEISVGNRVFIESEWTGPDLNSNLKPSRLLGKLVRL